MSHSSEGYFEYRAKIMQNDWFTEKAVSPGTSYQFFPVLRRSSEEPTSTNTSHENCIFDCQLNLEVKIWSARELPLSLWSLVLH